MKIQDEFKFFIENCTKATKSFEHYEGGLRNFVTERLKVLVEDFTDIYDYKDPSTVEDFINILSNDEVFTERDTGPQGHNMYSSSISSYLKFLKARQYFSSLREEPSQTFKKNPSCLQKIYYGAPGTGKSYKIDNNPEVINVIRTTFHPDSDYSTFVGAYKPTMGKPTDDILSIQELKEKLRAQKSKDKQPYPCHIFAAQYWYSLSTLDVDQIKNILEDCGFTESMYNEIHKGIAVGRALSKFGKGRIIYEFVPQAFLKAYIAAWKNYPDPQYLVIEEINRGNCAQIFGDIFQLLDRDEDGFSKFPIVPDNDLQQYVSKQELSLGNLDLKSLNNSKGSIENGEILALPSNLYIWATMNTSDQSLFPIDSAFKRRWDWEYVSIAQGVDKCGEKLDWKIAIGDKEYNWWTFLSAINQKIVKITGSGDKQLGFFFCNTYTGIIEEGTFVNKVLFYLWNDVFKDYGFDNKIFKNGDSGTLTFEDFFTSSNGETVINSINVLTFVKNVIGKETEKNDDGTGSVDKTTDDTN